MQPPSPSPSTSRGGWFDYRRKGEDPDEGYLSTPVNWGISSGRKRGFFNLCMEISGVGNP